MLLYHYAANFFEELKTREKQDGYSSVMRDEAKKENDLYLKKTGIRRPGLYTEHISFFIEKPPLKEISNFFPKDHEVWFKGNKLYEYTIESSSILDFKFEVVEFPEKTEIYYNDEIDLETYYSMLRIEINENGYIGSGNKALEKVTKKLLGNTKSYFEELKTRPNYKDICYKYAATVPHLMLYPDGGYVQYKNVNKVICG